MKLHLSSTIMLFWTSVFIQNEVLTLAAVRGVADSSAMSNRRSRQLKKKAPKERDCEMGKFHFDQYDR